MLGAIIGDVVESVYEFERTKSKHFEPFIHPDAVPTDDSVLTVAVADALLHGRDFAESFKDWGRRYADVGWGAYFFRWLFSETTKPYGSFGNGSAMRCSPCALLAKSLDEALELARRSAAVTHNHPEGIKGAQATVMAIFLAREGLDSQAIRARIADFSGYDLDRTVDEIRPGYTFDETCQGSVPEALICSLEAESFEDAIRNAISLGGDADTQAAIAGAVAEARFGIPPDIRAEILRRLPKDMRAVVDAFHARIRPAAEGVAGGPQACGSPSLRDENP